MTSALPLMSFLTLAATVPSMLGRVTAATKGDDFDSLIQMTYRAVHSDESYHPYPEAAGETGEGSAAGNVSVSGLLNVNYLGLRSHPQTEEGVLAAIKEAMVETIDGATMSNTHVALMDVSYVKDTEIGTRGVGLLQAGFSFNWVLFRALINDIVANINDVLAKADVARSIDSRVNQVDGIQSFMDGDDVHTEVGIKAGMPPQQNCAEWQALETRENENNPCGTTDEVLFHVMLAADCPFGDGCSAETCCRKIITCEIWSENMPPADGCPKDGECGCHIGMTLDKNCDGDEACSQKACCQAKESED